MGDGKKGRKKDKKGKKGKKGKDAKVLRRIEKLVAEEHALYEKEAGLADDERARLDDLQVQLDRCWDLLRQRRARREFGNDPDRARARDAETVESYEQ